MSSSNTQTYACNLYRHVQSSTTPRTNNPVELSHYSNEHQIIPTFLAGAKFTPPKQAEEQVEKKWEHYSSDSVTCNSNKLLCVAKIDPADENEGLSASESDDDDDDNQNNTQTSFSQKLKWRCNWGTLNIYSSSSQAAPISTISITRYSTVILRDEKVYISTPKGLTTTTFVLLFKGEDQSFSFAEFLSSLRPSLPTATEGPSFQLPTSGKFLDGIKSDSISDYVVRLSSDESFRQVVRELDNILDMDCCVGGGDEEGGGGKLYDVIGEMFEMK